MSLTCRILTGALFAGYIIPVYSYDVLVSVTGNLIGNTCVVSSDSEVMSVPLGNIGTKQFSKARAVSNIKSPFTLKLEECGPTFSGVKVTFSGTPDTQNPELIKVADGGATGVAVQILDKHGNLVPLNTQSIIYGNTNSESVEMVFFARLVATGAGINTGSVSAVATWTTEYQ